MIHEAIKKRASSLLNGVQGFWEGVPEGVILSDDAYARLINALARLSSLDTYTLFQSGVSMINRPLTRLSVGKFCYFIAANMPDLKSGRIIPMDEVIVRDGRQEVRFTGTQSIEPDRVRVWMQILTGPFALKIISATITDVYAYAWLRRIGYTGKPGSKYIYPEPKVAFPGLFGRASFDTRRGTLTRLHECLLDIVEDAGTVAYNRKHILSFRYGITPCVFGNAELILSDPEYCVYRCIHGWNTCPASGHEEEYSVRACEKCGRSRAPFSSESPSHCVDCERAESRTGKYD